ncbi:MAG: hypothetical protein GX442_05295 [Candidatus Riflebacteria bacterium]|nr:hypothetical protein [Candidatus Riflebacteria bacterium]
MKQSPTFAATQAIAGPIRAGRARQGGPRERRGGHRDRATTDGSGDLLCRWLKTWLATTLRVPGH